MINKKGPTYRLILSVILMLSLLATVASFVLQYVYHYNPCPLCIFQRIALISTGLVTLVLLVLPQHHTFVKVISATLVSIPAIFGVSSAARQLYLQQLPPEQIPSCGPGLEFLLTNNSYLSVLQKVFHGSGECATVEKVFYLPLPVWSLIICATVVLLAIGGFFFTQRG